MLVESLITIGVLFALLGLRVPVAFSLLGAAFAGLTFAGEAPRAAQLVAANAWRIATDPVLITIPAFALMGAALSRSRITRMTFDGLESWTALLPGQLLHMNTVGSAIVGAVVGSTTASCAIMTFLTYDEMKKRGYPTSLILGTLGGATTIGVLIPPSIPLILFGILTETSILKLWTAGIIPGLVLMVLFSIYVAVAARLGWLKNVARVEYDWRARWRALPKLFPLTLLIALVLGSLYAGIASPTEAAAWGAVGTLAVAVCFRELTWRFFWDSCKEAAIITSVVMFIVIGAVALGTAWGYLGAARLFVNVVVEAQLSPGVLLLLLLGIYLILGMLFEAVSMILLTVPIVFPVVEAAGISPLWFGIFITIMVQAAQITPPVGMNLFLLSTMTGHPVGEIVRANLPFLLLMVASLALFWVFPGLIEWLPNVLFPGQ